MFWMLNGNVSMSERCPVTSGAPLSQQPGLTPMSNDRSNVTPLRGLDVDGEARQLLALRNYEAEQALLAAMLADNRTVARVSDIVRAADFADPLHGRIFTAIRELVTGGHTANFLTLHSRFDADAALVDIGGAKYLARLENAVVTIVGCEDYACVVRDLSIRRQCVSLAHDLAAQCTAADLATEVAALEASHKLRALVAGEAAATTTAEIVEGIVNGLARPPPRWATGLPGLDRSMGGGLYAGKLYAIAARKKAGKTTILGTISFNLNYAGTRHVFVTGEMSPTEIEQRNMARKFGINSLDFLTRRGKEELIGRAAEYAATAPRNIVWEHAPGCNLEQLQNKILRAISRDGVTGFIVDYWQIVGGKSARETEEWHLRNVAQTLADICQRERVWGLVTAQLNQDGNTRGGEGLRLACDAYWTLHREKGSSDAWMEHGESRYTPYRDVGSKDGPGLILNTSGPWFEDITGAAIEPDWQPR